MESPQSMTDDRRPFVHLRCHTEYTFLRSTVRVPALFDRAETLGMNAVAITDCGNLHAVQMLARASKFRSNGELRTHPVKPIIGLDLDVDLRGSELEARSPSHCRLTLLARNRIGLKNLVRLSSLASDHPDYIERAVSLSTVLESAEGQCCLLGGSGSELTRLLTAGHQRPGHALVRLLQRAFSESLYLAIENHGQPGDREGIEATADLARRCGVELIATNDVHFLEPIDAEAQSILIEVGRYCYNWDLADSMPESDFKPSSSMYQLLPDYPEAVATSQAIADTVEPISDIIPFRASGEITGRRHAHKLLRVPLFSRLRSRPLLFGVGRILGMEEAEVQRIASLVAFWLRKTFVDVLNESAEFHREYESNRELRRVIRIAEQLEGLAHYPTVGWSSIAADQSVIDLLPTYRSRGNGDSIHVMSQWSDLDQLVKENQVDYLPTSTHAEQTAAPS